MQIWPKERQKLQRIASAFFLLYLAAFLLALTLLIKFLKLASLPQPSLITETQTQPQEIICPQRVDNTGWTIKDGLIRTFPRCLTVTNSRLGSRLNFDWYFSQQQVKASTLGNQEDHSLFFNLKIDSEPIFPTFSNPSFPQQSIDLGLTFQKINFENEDFLVSLEIESPFSPSQSIDDPNTKLSHAPFFYLHLSLENKTPFPQAKTITLSLANAEAIKNQNDLQIITFKDQTRKDGLLALAALKPELTPFIKPFRRQNLGGFSWQTKVNPHSQQSATLVYAGFLDQTVIADNRLTPQRKSLKFAYTQWFKNIEEIIEFAFKNKKEIQDKTSRFEKRFHQSPLSPQEKWLLAQAFHSYLGNTFLVSDEKEPNRFEYFVWEGEFKYLNTLDVAHDYAVLEGLYFPWLLKLALQSWCDNAKEDEFGAVIPHDLGLRFNYTGSQAYAIKGQETSGMPVEENANFILLSYWYWQQTGDHEFIKDLSPLIKDLIVSLKNRDTNQNGLADRGIGMTTYDNDGNLALMKAPDSTYLGIKQLAAYLSAEKIFQAEKSTSYSILVHQQAELITKSLKEADNDYGFIPLSLDPQFEEYYQFGGQTIKGIQEQGFAFITGLFYPSLGNLDSPLLKELTPILADSYQQAYQKCLVKNEKEKIIGLKLAQYQNLGLGWLSHSAMADFIAQKLFDQEYHSGEIYFPLLCDSPAAYSDGQYFREPFYPPQVSLNFYPRGAALFSQIK